jgi:hypothetical protein
MAFDLLAFQSTEILVPMLFSLAVIFGILEITNIFKNRAVNFLIALGMAFFAVSNSFYVSILWSYFGDVAIFFIVMFFIAFVFEVFGVRKGKHVSADSVIINGVILFILLSIGYLYMDMLPDLPFIGGGENLFLLIAVIFILSIFWSAYKAGGGPEEAPGK